MFQLSNRITARLRSLKNTPSSAELAAAEERVWAKLMHNQATSPTVQTAYQLRLHKGIALITLAFCITLFLPAVSHTLQRNRTPVTNKNSLAFAIPTKNNGTITIQVDAETIKNQVSGAFGYLSVPAVSATTSDVAYAGGSTYQPVYFYTDPEGLLYRYNLVTKKKTRLGEEAKKYGSLSFSSQNQQLAVEVYSPNNYLAVLDSNSGKELYRTTSAPMIISWSPDGSRLLAVLSGDKARGVIFTSMGKATELPFDTVPLADAQFVPPQARWYGNNQVSINFPAKRDGVTFPENITGDENGPWYSKLDYELYFEYRHYVIDLKTYNITKQTIAQQQQTICVRDYPDQKYTYYLSDTGNLESCNTETFERDILQVGSQFTNLIIGDGDRLLLEKKDGNTTHYQLFTKDKRVVSAFSLTGAYMSSLIGSSNFGIAYTTDQHVALVDITSGKQILLY